MMKDISEQLVESLNEFVAVARGRLGAPEVAADAVQESLLTALKKGETPREAENSKAWFYRILRRTIIDLYRHREIHERTVEDTCRVCAKNGCPDCACETSSETVS